MDTTLVVFAVFVVLMMIGSFIFLYEIWTAVSLPVKILMVVILVALVRAVLLYHKKRVEKAAQAKEQARQEEERAKQEEEAHSRAIQEAAARLDERIAREYGGDELGLRLLTSPPGTWDAVNQQNERERIKNRLASKRLTKDEYKTLVQQQKQEEAELYFYDGQLKKQPLSQESVAWVENDSRIEFIEEVIRSSGLFDHGDMSTALQDRLARSPQPPHDAPYLLTATGGNWRKFSSLDTKNSSLKERLNWKAGTPARREIFAHLYSLCQVMEMYSCELSEVFSRIGNLYLKEYAIAKAGLEGEEAVQEVLDMHAGAFFVLYNLRLEFPGKEGEKPDSVETDALVLAPNGIFAIETKNYGASGSYRIVVSADGNWYREYLSSHPDKPPVRSPMANPFAQNDRHIAYLERFINALLGRDMAHWARVKNVVVVANDTVEMDSQLSADHVLTRVGNLYQHLSADREPLFTMEELTAIKTALEAKNLPPKKYPIADYRKELRTTVENSQHLLEILRLTNIAFQNILENERELLDLPGPDQD